MASEKQMEFMNKMADRLTRVGSQIHLRSIRDAIATLMPFYILGGLAVLINCVVFEAIFKNNPAALATAQFWGNTICNGTMNISGFMMAPVIAFCLSRNKGFTNPMAALIAAAGTLIMMMPAAVSVTPNGAANPVEIGGALLFGNLGTSSMFAGIIVGLLSAELFLKFVSIKKLQIDLGEQVPPAVSKSFNVLIPLMLTMSIFAVVAMILHSVFHTDLIQLIKDVIQAPLKNVGASIWGVIGIYILGNFLFAHGIHQSTLTGLLEPIIIALMQENMTAFANHQEVPHIMNYALVNCFITFGGSGCTLALIIAIFLVGKDKASKDICKMAIPCGIFEINEPILFGLPIVFNYVMIIPFLLVPSISIGLAYFATAIGLMNKMVVMVPWTTPPFINTFLATGGDWRAPVVHLVIAAISVIIYLPFVKINEMVQARQAAQQQE